MHRRHVVTRHRAMWQKPRSWKHRMSSAERDSQGPSSPNLTSIISTEDHPKFKSYVWEPYPNAPWILSGWSLVSAALGRYSSSTSEKAFPDTQRDSPRHNLMPFPQVLSASLESRAQRCHTAHCEELWAAMRPPFSSSALAWAHAGTASLKASETRPDWRLSISCPHYLFFRVSDAQQLCDPVVLAPLCFPDKPRTMFCPVGQSCPPGEETTYIREFKCTLAISNTGRATQPH